MGPTTFDVYIWGFVETRKWFWWTFNKTTPDSVRSRLNSLRARPGQAGTARSGECNAERERERLNWNSGSVPERAKPQARATATTTTVKTTKSQHISYFIYYLERVRCINQIRNEYDITTPKSTSVSVPVSAWRLKTAIQFQIQTEIRFASSIRPVDQHINWKWK